jgi:tetratricopeptide (TPR) repeat protein
LLREAINADQGFFPARIQLAGLELAASNWDAVLEQQRWLANNRASFANDLALAKTLRQKGDTFYYEAETILLRWEPTEKAAQIELGRLYRAAGRIDAAEQVLNRAATEAPPSSEAAFEYAQLLETQGQFEAAAAQYERAVEVDGGNTAARVALANLYARSLNRMDEAVRQYQALVNAEISDPGQLLQAGDVLLRYGDARGAYNAYSRAREVNPDDPLIYHKLAQASLARGNLSRARNEAQEALDRSGGALAEAHIGMGEIERREGNRTAAREAFERGRAINPNLAEAYIGLGQVTADEGRWSVALGYFQNAVALDPNDPLVHFWLAEALLRQPEPQLAAAIDAYSQTLTLQPIFPEAKLGLAHAYDASGNPEATWQYLEQALAQRPAYAEALLLRGKLHQQAGNDEQALVDYNASINANDEIAESYFRRGLLEVQREEYRAARRDLSRALELQDNFAEARYWLGRSYFIEGNYEAALNEFDQALALRPDYAEAQAYREQAQQRLNAVSAAAS